MGAERAQKKAAAGVAWRKGSSGAVGVWGTEERALRGLEDEAPGREAEVSR